MTGKAPLNFSPESTTDASTSGSKESETTRAACLTMTGSVLVFYASFGLMSSFGFFQDFYAHEFLRQTPNSSIAFIGTLQMALTNLMAAVSGALCDRYGIKVSQSLSVHD
jgi:MCP family monocarboxylic acid transporter-like MFS transporter 10